MSEFVWEDCHAVGVPEIDAQHRGLVELINALDRVLIEEDDIERVCEVKARTIDALVDYGITHFECEEKYMHSIDFPDIQAHRKEHQLFVARVQELRDELMTVHGVRASQVMRAMTDWLHDHLLTRDRKYAEFAGSLRR